MIVRPSVGPAEMIVAFSLRPMSSREGPDWRAGARLLKQRALQVGAVKRQAASSYYRWRYSSVPGVAV
jgi:hypothetical protein